jgi:hypothetical protein
MARFDGIAQGRHRLGRAAPLCLVLLLFAAAPAWAAPSWLDPADLSKPGRDATNPVIGVDSLGESIAMWERQSTVDPSINLQISTRAPGGSFSEPVDFLQKPSEPDLAMTPRGEAVAIWKRLAVPLGVYVIEAASRPPGGSFSAPVTVYTAPPKVIPQELEVALGEGGNVAISWGSVDPGSGLDKLICGVDPKTLQQFKCPNPPFVMASVRRAGGGFSPAERISPPRGTGPGGESEKEKEEREIKESQLWAGQGRVGIDPAGNAVAIWSYFDGKDSVIQTAAREGETFDPPAQLSESGENAGEPAVGMDSAGNAIAVWSRNEGSNRAVQAGVRPSGGSFAPLGDISASNAIAQSPSLAVNSGGTAIVAWRLAGFSETFIQTATRPPGGAFSAPVGLSSGKDNPLFPDVAMNDAGAAVVAWSGLNASNQIARATVRPAGGSFGPPVAISQSSPDLFHPHLAMDLAGDATAVWSRSNGTHDIVQMAGYDGSPPRLRDVSIPSSAKVGESLRLSATSEDEWPIGPPHFDFGDGATADGALVLHAYSAPGAYPVTVTATDAGGTSVTATGTTRVKARNDFTIGKLSRNRRKGTATLAVTVPEPGSTVVSGKGMKKATVKAARGGTLKLPLKAAAKGLKRLKRSGRLKAQLKIAYSPEGGDTNSVSHKVTLLKKLG